MCLFVVILTKISNSKYIIYRIIKIMTVRAGVGTVAEPNRYIMIATSGGLNQQRTGVS